MRKMLEIVEEGLSSLEDLANMFKADVEWSAFLKENPKCTLEEMEAKEKELRVKFKLT